MSKRVKSLNGRLYDQGYVCIGYVQDERLGSGDLVNLLFDRERYSAVKVVPSDVAFEGSGLQTIEPDHMVYVKYKKGAKRGFRIVQPGFINRNTGDIFSSTPVHTIR